jgi:hypothetical protein
LKRYEILFHYKGFFLWSLVRVLTRFPIAAGPIGFLLFSKTILGNYDIGAWMAASYAVCETIAAPTLGARLGNGPMLQKVRYSLVIAAASFFSIAVGAKMLTTPLLLLLSGLAGGATAGLQGGLRSLLTRTLDHRDVPAALSWESVLHQFVYAFGPIAVTSLALGIDGRVPLLLMGGTALASTLLVIYLPNPRECDQESRSKAETSARRELVRAWPIYLTSAVVAYLIATVELVLSPLLEEGHLPISWTGPLLSVFAVASLLGGLCYGLRTWPASYRSQSLILLIGVSALIGCTGIEARTGLISLVISLILAGFLYSALLTTRNLSLHERLPRNLDATGYSFLYAGSGFGFSISAVMSGLLLSNGTARTALLIACALTLLVGIVSATAEGVRGHGKIISDGQVEVPADGRIGPELRYVSPAPN